MKNFALLGVAGYIASRHLRAIKETGNNLIVSLDKNDSVGILDSYFPDSAFFVEYERFDRYIEKIKRKENIKLDYVSICTPNYLHDSHVRMALRLGANAICEKPLVLNPWNLDALEAIQKESNKKINTILQLRLHPDIIKLKERVGLEKSNKKYNVDLTYITSRGKWYGVSWKGDESKSGGVTTNIGVHFFDMLSWVFGDIQESYVHMRKFNKAAGYFEFSKARVRWFLSIDKEDLPNKNKIQGLRTFRSMKVDEEEIEFSSMFDDLHARSYEGILNNEGFSIEDVRTSVEISYNIRNQEIVNKAEKHFFL